MKLPILRSVYFSVLLFSLAIASWYSLSRPTQTVLRYWLADLQNFTAAPANLLLGSSSLARLDTVLLEDCGSWHNRAIGNSQLSDIRRYLNWTPRRQQPAHLVLYGGENDLARQQTPQQVSTAYIALLQQLQARYPRAKLHILALKYSPARLQHW
ncbi:MAG TPA: hypothetical protein VFY01_09130, partial [Rheinheimera sp.]|nr:hypothetical protein [Rheinheimera sp.]